MHLMGLPADYEVIFLFYHNVINRRSGGKTAVMAVKPPFNNFALFKLELQIFDPLSSFIV